MRRYLIFILILLSFVFSCVTTDTGDKTASTGDAVLQLDSAIVYGKLDNGLTYYIRRNTKPEQRAELRLVVNAGSVLEDDNQRGIAHFLEHLAFNGTLHFKKNTIVDYLESIGMRFGSDLNAATGYDDTTYRLQVPTDKKEKLETGLLILEDWAHNITIAPDEVDKERKVIIEEWRSDRGADERIRDLHLADVFAGSRYAQRMPIGDIKTIETVSPETIRKFYTDWYRPDLMSVIVVGDVDPDWVKAKIEQQFGAIAAPRTPRERNYYRIPDNSQPIISIAADKEATSAWLKLYYKKQPEEIKTESDYRSLVKEHLFYEMINARLSELIQKPESPFVAAYSGSGRFVRTEDVGMLAGVVKEGRMKDGLDVLLTEAERIKKYGFVYTELERSKQNAITSMEQAFNNRDKRESSVLAAEYIRNYLYKETVPGIEKEYELYEKFVPAITIEEMNQLASTLFPDTNRVLLVALPEKQGARLVTAEDLSPVFASVKKANIQPYVDEKAPAALVRVPPQKGSVVSTTADDKTGITELVLSNGTHVLLKQTDFKNDEIVMRAFAPGGLSLVSESNFVPASTAPALVAASGAGGLNRTQLAKLLAGKQVQVTPYIDELFEGFTGGSRKQDIKEMFELLYLYFTDPSIDADAFATFRENMITSLRARTASPENVYWDTIKSILANNHPRSAPWTPETANLLDMKKSLAVYKERFHDASNFTFVFVGDFTLEKITPYIETYIAGLPSYGKKEHFTDLNMYPPNGIIKKELHLGKDPKSLVQIIFHGDFSWNLDEVVALGALSEIMDMRLTSSIREDQGGTYGISAWDYPKKFPKENYMFFINFSCDPLRVDQLTRAVYQQIQLTIKNGITETELKSIKEIMKKEREVNLTKNIIWAELIKNYRLYNMPFSSITDYFRHIDALSAATVQAAAKKYLSGENRIEVILYPEANAAKKE